MATDNKSQASESSNQKCVMSRKPFYSTLLLALALSISALVGCDSVTGDNQAPGGAITEGNVLVKLTDAPIGNIAEAHVIIERIELVSSDEQRIILSEKKQEFDLLTLQDGITADLAEVSVPAAEYRQLRLIVADSAYVVLTDDTKQRLKVPGGTHTGIKINIPAFEINNTGDEAVITVDFDASQSFVQAENSGLYLFKPIIKPKATEVNGEEIEKEVKVEGLITALSDSTIDVEDISLRRTDATKIESEGDGSLSVGSPAEIEVGYGEDSTFLAVKIEVEDEEEDAEPKVEATLEEVGASHVTLLGTRFDVTSATELDGVRELSGLKAGDNVEIKFARSTGNAYLALDVETEVVGYDADDENEDGDEKEGDNDKAEGTFEGSVEGAVTAIGSDHVVVSETRFAVDGDTELNGLSNLSELSTGTKVEVEFAQLADGSYLALEIEVEEDEGTEEDEGAEEEGGDDDSGDSTENNPNSEGSSSNDGSN